jgi:hypothetical protein
VFVCVKLLAVFALLSGFVFYFTPLHPWSYLVYSDRTAGPLLAFINWDGQHYLRLAIGGYPLPADPSSAFFPLFPALIALVMLCGLGPIAAGLTVATLASLAVFVLLERLLPDNDRGASSLWLFASFSTAFYLSTVYAEGLFLALLLALLLSLRRANSAFLAAAAAAALPLARGEGLWLALPLAVAWIASLRGHRHAPERRSLRAATAGYVAGSAAYFAFFAMRYGDPLAGLRIQHVFVFKNAIANLYDLPRFVAFLLTPPAHFLDTVNSGLDKSMMAVSLACLALGARRTADPMLLALWACFALLPALMGEGGSYARHALLAWACFVLAIGPVLKPWLKWPLVAAGFMLQAYLAFCFGANRWVG